MKESIFTNIINRKIPADIVYEDDLSIVFKDIHPVAPIHLLIVPKKLIPTINDIEAEDMALIGHLHRIAAQVAHDFGVADSGYRLVWNCNRDGGQEVYHIHMHLIAGRTCSWPPFANT